MALVICILVTLIESHMNELKKRGISCPRNFMSEEFHVKVGRPIYLFGMLAMSSRQQTYNNHIRYVYLNTPSCAMQTKLK